MSVHRSATSQLDAERTRSEFCPRTWWAIGNVLTEAGLPTGVLNVIFHRPEDAAQVTSALIEHPAIKKINFTGSTMVGRIISSQAGKNLKPVLMELGGKVRANDRRGERRRSEEAFQRRLRRVIEPPTKAISPPTGLGIKKV